MDTALPTDDLDLHTALKTIAKSDTISELDNNISKEEAEHGVDLQGMFGLSYEQFDKLREKEIIKAIERGANIVNLDTANVKLIKFKKK